MWTGEHLQHRHGHRNTVGGGTVSAQSSVTIPGTQNPAITLAKTANPTTFSAPGVVITYS